MNARAIQGARSGRLKPLVGHGFSHQAWFTMHLWESGHSCPAARPGHDALPRGPAMDGFGL